MKSILLTTDFSDNARNALDYAIGVFGIDANYTLLNTFVEPSSTTSVMVSIIEFLQKESKEGLLKQKGALEEAFPGLNLSLQSQYGDLAVVINKMSDAAHFDYAVIGTKGASAVENFFIGSNTLNVVKTVKMALLVIPENSKYTGLNKIALAADFQPTDESELMKPLTYLAKAKDSELLIVNVRSGEGGANYDEAMEGFELHNVLEGVQHSFYSKEHDDVVAGIEEFVKEEKADVLAMIARKHTFFERLFNKSITKQISMLADIPLLILHE
ncbi:MAG: universal stress protein [Crocinitomicaceae bacterium]|nr:universal stress protein [Crocinitomicaceae bacterium]